MIYRTLLIIFRFALKQYFKHINVYFEKPLPEDRPVLFVANHQSAFMDALVVGSLCGKPLHFVSRGESFNTGWKRFFLKRLNMHPIYRKEFTPELAKYNPAAINAFQRLLVGGQSILIFPEGVSATTPRLAPIKTGAARIAIGAHIASIWAEPPVVVPVGLNYTNPHQFRSEVTLNFGPAIELEEYADQFLENEWDAIQSLTDKIESELNRLTLVIEEEELEEVVKTVEEVYKEELLQKGGISKSEWKRVFKTKKEIIQAAQYFKKQFPFRFKHITLHLDHYRQILLNYEMEDCWLREPKELEKGAMVFKMLFLLLSLPLFVFGFMNHIVALRLSKRAANGNLERPDFKGSMLLSYGVLFCLIFYVAQTIGVYYWTGSLILSLLYLVSLPLVGQFSLMYVDFYKNIRKDWRRDYFRDSNEELVQYLNEHRESLMRLLNGAREDYLI